MTKYDYIIGIDPDCVQSGIAVMTPKSRNYVSVSSMKFPQLLDFLQQMKNTCEINSLKMTVVVEGGWLVSKSNYHEAQGRRAEKIAKDVGANHETGRKILEMCEHYGIEASAQRPLLKCWKGSDRKITAGELKDVTGWDKRTNQDERDAALLAWYHSGLPIKVSV